MVTNTTIYTMVYEVVKRVPRGKVTTYGNIARELSKKDIKILPRTVGRALHNNKDSRRVPCHRVVTAQGKIAKTFAFGGASGQREKLMAEGVPFKNAMHVLLKSCLFNL